MKKNKLKIEKFRILSMESLQQTVGGTGDDSIAEPTATLPTGPTGVTGPTGPTGDPTDVGVCRRGLGVGSCGTALHGRASADHACGAHAHPSGPAAGARSGC